MCCTGLTTCRMAGWSKCEDGRLVKRLAKSISCGFRHRGPRFGQRLLDMRICFLNFLWNNIHSFAGLVGTHQSPLLAIRNGAEKAGFTQSHRVAEICKTIPKAVEINNSNDGDSKPSTDAKAKATKPKVAPARKRTKRPKAWFFIAAIFCFHTPMDMFYDFTWSSSKSCCWSYMQWIPWVCVCDVKSLIKIHQQHYGGWPWSMPAASIVKGVLPLLPVQWHCRALPSISKHVWCSQPVRDG